MPLDYSKFDRIDEFADERKVAEKERQLKIRQLERQRKEQEAIQGSKKAVAPGGGRTAVCTVTCEGVSLKLTLKEKLLERPFATCLVKPFLGAFNKKRSSAVAAADLAGIEVDGVAVTSLEVALEQRGKDVLLDKTLGQHDPSAMIDMWHESWKPAAGACWETTHEVTLLLAPSISALEEN